MTDVSGVDVQENPIVRAGMRRGVSDVPNSAAGGRHESSDLRPTIPSLRLRVVSSERQGQTIEIKASRCSVGSAANCSLRLRAAGVRPIHCLILRGPDGAVVRSLSADTTLNGQPFREQPLRAGDRLRFGPIELEVLENPAPAVDPPSRRKPAPNAAGQPSREQLPSVWTDPNSSRPIEVLSRIEELERQFHRLLLEGSPPTPEPGENPSATAAQTQTTEPPPSPIPNEISSFSEELKRIEHKFSELEACLNSVEQRLDKVAGQCEQAGQWQAELPLIRAVIDERHGLVVQATERLGVAEQRLDKLVVQCEQAGQWQSELPLIRALIDERHASGVQSSDRLGVAEQRLDKLVVQCEQAGQWQSELPLIRALIDERHETMAQAVELLRAELAGLAESHTALQAIVPVSNELTVSSDAGVLFKSESLAAGHVACPPPARVEMPVGLSSSDAGGKATENVDSQTSAPSPDAPRPSLEPRTELMWLAKQFAAASEPFNPDPTTLESGTVESPAGVMEMATGDADVEAAVVPSAAISVDARRYAAELPHPISSDPPTAEPSTAPAAASLESAETPTPPPSTDPEVDVFDRLAKVGIWRDVEHADGVSAQAGDNSTDRLTNAPEIPGGENSLLPAASSAAADQKSLVAGETRSPPQGVDDDSIESYMERLMQRVRGSSPAPIGVERFVAAEQTQESAPTSEPAVIAESPAPKEPEPLTVNQYVPRSQAPELDANLAAMRELANDSRHSNMLSHARRTWSANSKAKLVGSVVGIGVSISAVFFLDTYPMYAIIGLVAGLGTASVWAWQAFSFRRRLFGSLRK